MHSRIEATSWNEVSTTRMPIEASLSAVGSDGVTKASCTLRSSRSSSTKVRSGACRASCSEGATRYIHGWAFAWLTVAAMRLAAPSMISTDACAGQPFRMGTSGGKGVSSACPAPAATTRDEAPAPLPAAAAADPAPASALAPGAAPAAAAAFPAVSAAWTGRPFPPSASVPSAPTPPSSRPRRPASGMDTGDLLIGTSPGATPAACSGKGAHKNHSSGQRRNRYTTGAYLPGRPARGRTPGLRSPASASAAWCADHPRRRWHCRHRSSRSGHRPPRWSSSAGW